MSLWTMDHLSLLVLAVLLLVTDLRHSKQMFGFVEDVGSSLIMFDQFFLTGRVPLGRWFAMLLLVSLLSQAPSGDHNWWVARCITHNAI